ncbi:MAG: DUF421 domain-containing protein [Acidobacteriota bacterium]|nr:DUF421 domain-containing protein [Acidobacteriota bacterium]
MDKLFAVDWNSIFIPSNSILEIIVRGTLIYFICFAFLRVVRRGVGEIGITDILIIVLIADAAQNGMSSDYKSVTEGFALIGTLIFWDYLFDFLGTKSKFFEHLLDPPKIPLIKDGEMIIRNMRKQMITREELRSQLRLQGVEDVSEVRECYLEGSGSISVIKKKPDDDVKKPRKATP